MSLTTKEPWRVNGYLIEAELENTENPKTICPLGEPFRDDDGNVIGIEAGTVDLNNGKRICQCVNAMARIPKPENVGGAFHTIMVQLDVLEDTAAMLRDLGRPKEASAVLGRCADIRNVIATTGWPK